MTITLNQLGLGNTQVSNTETITSSSFTATADGRLFAVAMSDNFYHLAPHTFATMTATGYTFTLTAQTTPTPFGEDGPPVTASLFTAPDLGTPTEDAVATHDPFTNDATAYQSINVFEAVGSVLRPRIRTVAGIPQISTTAVIGDGSAETLTTNALPVTPLVTSTLVCAALTGWDGGSGIDAPPTNSDGWTIMEPHSCEKLCSIAIFHTTGTTDSVTSFSAMSLGLVLYKGAIVFELEEDDSFVPGVAPNIWIGDRQALFTSVGPAVYVP